MKKLTAFLILILILAACAPANVPAEVPATEYPIFSVIEAPVVPTVAPQTEGRIFFTYSYTEDIPRAFFQGSDVEQETITFTKKDGVWQPVDLKPQIVDLGPLFRIYLSRPLANTYGDCGVNTINLNEITTKVVVQPICETIPSESMVSLEIGIANCDKDSYGNLICGVGTETGSLRYVLNEKMDKFQFIVDGSYNYVYEEWIRLALNGLGFDPLPDDYFDGITPGQNNVILKTNPNVEE
ncbi:hypothetical protein A3K29_05690 [Candidatus Collierbacteria bacterium RIFOXYB2_FULL_46_14]|uniref:Bacterial spore germination immunoglobulin-like domain-containing protein n=1 Tax=Candidatus Collierbacteria bacterium GW2011_GWA2_46_26 TaxID=1618381 RepID=A0A0G1PIF5_9BACT|nr:MAG: hypothetical protein UX47_C0009G0021 [Candidatus Collierbacteria bacterium GW2011_GWA2_46_26]OGD73581.1 MAG: hypothetical protein A3K29_05690 [Candidatus Collierbacteria bacterium RIFOXYB2_FULL_46_14]OGD76623.1 MAG: hypothetical protein A3K43_05690 [Candidatus Collierbacteria bacterium RIFOXYA2_FULL_46_20]OGD77959.1 MAG: hypothetical protein A3K39_05690 [Candidatus Collierbacteria bacterium RIFOXYC2_FULL_43_15]OGD79983.1 MAG: hypothetical protein A2320_00120 [Pseudomonadales bacterium G